MRNLLIIFTLIASVACMGNPKNNSDMEKAKTSIFDLDFELNDGSNQSLNDFKGKKILFVNTASECGFTKQYEDLEKLHQQYKDKLVVIAFPSNEFGGQEPGSDQEIAAFCQKNYGVTFLIASKSIVKAKEDKSSVYQWLTDENKNGWNSDAPSWNFAKYLVDEAGNLLSFYPSNVNPLDEKITSKL